MNMFVLGGSKGGGWGSDSSRLQDCRRLPVESTLVDSQLLYPLRCSDGTNVEAVIGLYL